MDQKKAEARWIEERRDAIQRLAAPQRPPLNEGDYFLGDEAYYHGVSKFHQQHLTVEDNVAQTPAEIRIKIRSDAETRRLRAFAIDSAARVAAGMSIPTDSYTAQDVVNMAKKFMDYIETGEL